MEKPSLQFVRNLAGYMANIPSDAAIYDGGLEAGEVKGLSSALTELSKAQIYIKDGKFIELDGFFEIATAFIQQSAGAGLIVADNAQQIYCKAITTNAQSTMRRLSQLSESINAPVVALFQLDSSADPGDFLLTRNELALMEKLSADVDEVMLMGGSPGELSFHAPKIPKRG